MPPNGITNDHFCRGLPSWTGFSSTYRIAASMACSLSRNTFHCCSAHMDGNLPSAVAEIFQPERLRQASPGQRPGCEVKRVALQAVSLREKGARNALGKKATPLALHIAGTRPISSPVPSKKQYLLCLAHITTYTFARPSRGRCPSEGRVFCAAGLRRQQRLLREASSSIRRSFRSTAVGNGHHWPLLPQAYSLQRPLRRSLPRALPWAILRQPFRLQSPALGSLTDRGGQRPAHPL